MHVNRWSADFGLRKCEDLKKETALTKFVVIVTTIGIILFAAFYLCIFLLRDDMEQRTIIVEDDSTNSTDPSTPQKLIHDQFIPRQPPRPFINHMRGPPPASFIPVPIPTERTTNIFPQLQNYARPGYPRNIQDIISYISPAELQQQQLQKYGPKKHLRPINLGPHDPFYSYKPKDPSDINLLATANVRFAPPAWKDLKTNPLPVPSPSSHKPLETHIKFDTSRSQKSLKLTLNVFPMPNDKQNYYGVASNTSPRFVNYVSDRTKRILRPRKMVIHLNVYGDEGEDVERAAVSLEDLKEILTPPGERD